MKPRVRVAGGLQEDGIAVGNTFDKYGTRNPIARRLLRNFATHLDALLERAGPGSVHEVGCGEGFWTITWATRGRAVRGSDFSAQVIELARANAADAGVAPEFTVRSVYDLEPGRDSADVLVCCEVLEHLDDPARGLRALADTTTRYLIVTVPREPVWRAMNLARGRYVRQLGNTPGHVNHWSRRALVRELLKHFEIVEVRTPIPWTMALCRLRTSN